MDIKSVLTIVIIIIIIIIIYSHSIDPCLVTICHWMWKLSYILFKKLQKNITTVVKSMFVFNSKKRYWNICELRNVVQSEQFVTSAKYRLDSHKLPWAYITRKEHYVKALENMVWCATKTIFCTLTNNVHEILQKRNFNCNRIAENASNKQQSSNHVHSSTTHFYY